MANYENTPSDPAAVGLVHQAIDQTKDLARTQAELIKRELEHQLHDASPGLLFAGAAIGCAMGAIVTVLTGVSVATFRRHPGRRTAMLATLFAGAGVYCAWNAYLRLPLHPLDPIARQMKSDVAAALRDRS